MRKPFVLILFLVLASVLPAAAQRNILQTMQNGIPQGGGGPTSDSVVHRNKNEDSITISYRYLDTAGRYKLDSSIINFYGRYPVPFTHQWLGNTGNASQPLLFTPRQATGFDPGFHAFDAYKLTLDKVRFYNTTRPYTELGYVIGAGGQQVVDLIHTQNLKPTWNVSLRYRLINAQGTFNNQNSNHNNYLVSSWYQSPNRRYNNFVVFLGNKLESSENGGILTDQNYLDDPVYSRRISIPTVLASGTSQDVGGALGDTKVSTGNKYNEFRFMLRQQYDLGRKDSLVTDSTVIPLFFPRLRIEHTLTYGKYQYVFADAKADSVFYHDNYGMFLGSDSARTGTVLLRDDWKELTNDLSLYQFPVADNQAQFIRVGASVQMLQGAVRQSLSYTNIWLHGEYRNRTRNQKWDAIAAGELWLTGYNRGDFHAQVSLKRLLGSRLGSLQVGFENSNRTPSFIYDARSNFYLDAPKTFYKENSTRVFARVFNPRLGIELGADYHLITNYLYLTGYRSLSQENDVFNLVRVQGKKNFRIRKNFHLDAELNLQQQAGNAAVHVPLVFAIARLYYSGNLGFKNLNFAGGFESRYASPYKADNYSPVLGRFSYQDSVQLSNRPDINAFIHFRIRGFKAFVRAENLNTLRFRSPGGFKEHSLAAPGYPYPGMLIRFGIYWSFVN